MTDHTVNDVIQTDTGFLTCVRLHSPNMDKQDCRAIEDAIDCSEDAQYIQPGMRIVLRGFAGQSDTTTLVRIAEQPLAGTAYVIELEHARDVGGTIRDHLGLWMPGEGRAAIRGLLYDYIKSKLAPKEGEDRNKIVTRCPNPAHGMYESRINSEKMVLDPYYRHMCLWHMVMEGMCTACLNKNSPVAAGNFGIDPDLANYNPKD